MSCLSLDKQVNESIFIDREITKSTSKDWSQISFKSIEREKIALLIVSSYNHTSDVLQEIVSIFLNALII